MAPGGNSVVERGVLNPLCRGFDSRPPGQKIKGGFEMIATTKEITDKKQLLLMKQNIEKKLEEIGKDWGYIQKTTLLDASTIQRFIDLKGISEDDLNLILQAVNVSVEKEPQPEITPKEEKSEKITPKVEKWSYEKFRDMVLEELREKKVITSKDIKEMTGKPAPFWLYHIEKMKREGLITEFNAPNPGRGPKHLRAYKLPTMPDDTEREKPQPIVEPQAIALKTQLIEITLSNGETFKIEADEVEFTDPVLIRRKGKIVMAIDPEMFECVWRAQV